MENLAEDILKWLREMDYDPLRMPTNVQIEKLCAGKLGPIFHDIINRARPRKEVEHVRENIQIEALREHNSLHPSLQLVLWKRKAILKTQIEVLQKDVSVAQKHLDALKSNIRVKFLKQEETFKRQNELNQIVVLLRKKQNDMQSQITEWNELSDRVRGLTKSTAVSQDDAEVFEKIKIICAKLKSAFERQHSETLSTAYNSLDISSFLNRADFDILFDVTSKTERHLLKAHHVDSDILKGVQDLYTSDVSKVFDVMSKIRSDSGLELLQRLSAANGTDAKLRDSRNALYVEHLRSHLGKLNNQKNLNALIIKLKEAQRAESQESAQDLNETRMENGLLKSLDLKAEVTGSLRAIAELDLEINRLQGVVDNQEQLNIITLQIKDVSSKIGNLVPKLNYYLSLLMSDYDPNKTKCDILKSIARIKRNTERDGAAWMQLLTANFSRDEIVAFGNFPFTYNRHIMMEKSRLATNINDLKSVTSSLLDTHKIRLVSRFIVQPNLFPESIIIDFLNRSKYKDHKTLSNNLCIPQFNINCSRADLQKENGLLDEADENILKNEKRYHKIRAGSKALDDRVKLWVDMPQRMFISKSRLFNEKTFHYYQLQYEELYDKLKRI